MVRISYPKSFQHKFMESLRYIMIELRPRDLLIGPNLSTYSHSVGPRKVLNSRANFAVKALTAHRHICGMDRLENGDRNGDGETRSLIDSPPLGGVSASVFRLQTGAGGLLLSMCQT